MSTPAEVGTAEHARADHGEPATEHPEPAAGHRAPAIGHSEPAAGRPVDAAVDSPSGLDGELLERLNLAGRQLSAATVLFHTTLAELRGLSVTEEKAVDLLLRCGPLTHAALGEQTGLAPASVSDLIDRLERKGYARRTPHPQDRRRVLIEGQLDRIEEDLAPLFASWIQDLEELYRRYSRPELELLCDFMTRAAARQREAAARLAAH
jgi:DNA-binding MarR family transcriptional regulator